MFRRMLRQLSLVTAVLLTPVIAAPASAVEMTDRSFPLSEPRADVLAMRDRGQNIINLAGNFLLVPTRGIRGRGGALRAGPVENRWEGTRSGNRLGLLCNPFSASRGGGAEQLVKQLNHRACLRARQAIVNGLSVAARVDEVISAQPRKLL